MASRVNRAPCEAWAPRLACGPRGPGSYRAHVGQHSAACVRAGLAGRPDPKKHVAKGDKKISRF